MNLNINFGIYLNSEKRSRGNHVWCARFPRGNYCITANLDTLQIKLEITKNTL